jgi:hypothetical protein
VIEDLMTRLVREAPVIDATVVEDLRAALWSNGSPLALAIARIVELVAEGLVNPGIALPALAEACATLMSSKDPQVLAAAKFQIDTLEPLPTLVPLRKR